uniref:Protein IQ-DOMAIN 14-like n=1 Tax=Tanacetum cinerariifolium TaxID=118510 RepID=A0A699V4P4_TANCI|nr:protein IQ-DOMAIN 14-like [Tanacetum cinerariifolium]
MRMVPFTAAKSDSSRSSLSGYCDQPNYMSHTKSSRAKVRSLNAPGERRRSKYSNVQQNAKQPEAVGEPKKASYGGTQVSREVVLEAVLVAYLTTPTTCCTLSLHGVRSGL